MSDLGFGWRPDDRPRRGIVRLTLVRTAPIVVMVAAVTGPGVVVGISLKNVLAPPGIVAQSVTKVTVPEGLRTDETLALLAKRTHIPLRQFQQAARSGALDLPEYARGTLDGLLFPATYQVRTGQSAHSILQAMVTRFRQAAAEVGLGEGDDPFRTLTVASLAQAEGGSDADYPKITRVIDNRLAKHARLQLDTTVLYAQHRRSLSVSDADTRIRSPYNTYRISGLPPGPIDSPGESALRAAVHPAEGDWFWFVTTDPKNKITKFTASKREFAAFREELRRNLSRG